MQGVERFDVFDFEAVHEAFRASIQIALFRQE
jgi:hypothetical protein